MTYIVPFASKTVTRGGKVVCDPEGHARLKGALTYSRHAPGEMLFCVIPGKDPHDSRNDLALLMEQELLELSEGEALILRAPSDGHWGSHAVCKYAVDLARAWPDNLVLVSSWWHIPRLKVTCVELLGFKEYMRWVYTDKLMFMGIDTGKLHQDMLTEPLKFIGVLSRIALGNRLHRSLNGKL